MRGSPPSYMKAVGKTRIALLESSKLLTYRKVNSYSLQLMFTCYNSARDFLPIDKNVYVNSKSYNVPYVGRKGKNLRRLSL